MDTQFSFYILFVYIWTYISGLLSAFKTAKLLA